MLMAKAGQGEEARIFQSQRSYTTQATGSPHLSGSLNWHKCCVMHGSGHLERCARAVAAIRMIGQTRVADPQEDKIPMKCHGDGYVLLTPMTVGTCSLCLLLIILYWIWRRGAHRDETLNENAANQTENWNEMSKPLESH